MDYLHEYFFDNYYFHELGERKKEKFDELTSLGY